MAAIKGEKTLSELAQQFDVHPNQIAQWRTPPGHKIYPYLLRNMDITRPNQVWAMDITYVPTARGFV